MKMLKLFSANYRFRYIRFVRFALLFCVSVVGTLLGGEYFFRAGIITPMSSVIINIGLDPQRTQLVVSLLVTLAAAMVGGLLGRRKSGALVGAVIVFWFGYLAGFVQAELSPVYDASGLLEPLNRQALMNTELTMMGLVLLCAFLGAAIGIALAEVILDPCYELLRSGWRYLAQRRHSIWQEAAKPEMVARVGAAELPLWEKIVHTMSQWLGVSMAVIVLVLASHSVNLFQFTPDIGVHTAPPVPTHGTLDKGTFISQALNGQSKDFLIYLPPSYHLNGKKRYPVLYLLHGTPGSPVDWVNGGKIVEDADSLIATKKVPEFIAVMPDGNGRPDVTSEWGDSFDHNQLMETYVAKDLVEYIDQHYHTIPDAAHRAIGGLSMGGFGAMNIAEHHPDVFGSVISLGGYYYAEGGIWGNDQDYMQANSPMLTFPQNKDAWKLNIYLGAATNDEPYYKDTTDFISMLNTLNIPSTFDLQNGFHSWKVWQKQIANALIWLKWQ